MNSLYINHILVQVLESLVFDGLRVNWLLEINLEKRLV